MKRIVVCCDGTWNRPDQVDRGVVRSSNVAKMALAVAQQDREGIPQLVYYHVGVGTGRWDRIRGGAFGMGLSHNVRNAYRYLVARYEPGDELYFFGFSRGAYTVRSLAGLIRNCGVLQREHAARLDDAYALYRRRDDDSRPAQKEARLFRRTFTYEGSGHEVRIKCIGVWDTVGSLGIPVAGIGALFRVVFHLRFHDVDLSSYVDHAFQALAVDERRRPFRPSIWNQRQRGRDQGQVLKQRWFAGVHTNVGGGYEDPGLSDLALQWMIEEAQACGLAIDVTAIDPPLTPSSCGEMRRSMTALYWLLWPFRRPVTRSNAFTTYEDVHPSVDERRRRVPEYDPANVPAP